MWPPLLMLDPASAKSALDYRWDRRTGAHAKAIACGTPNHASSGGQGALELPDDALMFPWESCFSGVEVQFGRGKIGEWGEFEEHISGDIVLAARQYWYATGDKAWLATIGYPMAKGVAEFYAKRAVPRSYTVSTKGTEGLYDINSVMGPDEYAFPVNNSAYTNAAATIGLNFATEAAGVLGKKANPLWATVAKGLTLKVVDTVPGHPELKGGYHP
jgi:trehalose/maltose hydrolase-like predicted phosphorylase